MPWRGPELPNEFPTLGFEVGSFIEAHCVIPDGDRAGEPFLLTDEMWRFLLRFYRLDPTSCTFVYRRAQLIRPQGWGKGPLGAAIVIAEGKGPVLPSGWDAKGEPVGRPWATPWIQITAVSEDQTDNVWRALQPMIELGPLKTEIPDTGLTRINLHGGGLIEPVTSSAPSRLGQRLTFALQDETHSWTHRNKMTKVADTQGRNLAKMGGRGLETSNAWDPSEESVAQVTYESASTDILRDRSEPPKLSWENKRDRRKMMKTVYGDSVIAPRQPIKGWIDLDRIDAAFVELAERDVNQGLRYFLNMIVAGSGTAVAVERWDQLLEQRAPEPGERIGVGFDGSISEDCTVLVGTTGDGFQFLIKAWTRPANTPHWRVPRGDVADEVHRTFATYDVGLMLCDEAKWWSEIEDWQDTYGPERVLGLPTNSERRFAPMVDRWLTAIEEATLSHSDDQLLTDHVTAAQKQKARARDPEDDNRTLYVLTKPADGRKIDGAVAAVLSLAAAQTMELVDDSDPALSVH